MGSSWKLFRVDGNGSVSLKDLEQSLKEDVLAVSIMAVNNEIGTIQNIKGISELVRSAGALPSFGRCTGSTGNGHARTWRRALT